MDSNNKLMTIISHEYLKRVKSKTFIIFTLLGPVILLAYMGIIAFASLMASNNATKKLAILDKTNRLGAEIVALDKSKYFLSNQPEDSLKAQVLSEVYDGYVVIPEDVIKNSQITVYTRGGGGISFISDLENHAGKVLQKYRILDAKLDPKVIEIVEKDIKVNTSKITEKGTEKDYSEMYSILGLFAGLFVYMLMLIYGSIVLRAVIEEKTNRIIEIIASSARPFDIMLGKVIGIGCVGLTQTIFWVILSTLLFALVGPMVGSYINHPAAMSQMNGMVQQPQIPSGFELPHISPWLGLGFIFYFLSGYFIYSSLYAAIGSAVDQEQDAQQLQLPIMIPIILPVLFISPIMSNPDNTFAVIMSLIPFFTPIIMMVRIAATNVPIWQIILSVFLMIGTFFGTIWVAARIFRVGILMYGKKPSFGELIKWIKLSGR